MTFRRWCRYGSASNAPRLMTSAQGKRKSALRVSRYRRQTKTPGNDPVDCPLRQHGDGEVLQRIGRDLIARLRTGRGEGAHDDFRNPFRGQSLLAELQHELADLL